MNWHKPILRESGGFKFFHSGIIKLSNDGVEFKSHLDGKNIYNTGKVHQIQMI